MQTSCTCCSVCSKRRTEGARGRRERTLHFLRVLCWRGHGSLGAAGPRWRCTFANEICQKKVRFIPREFRSREGIARTRHFQRGTIRPSRAAPKWLGPRSRVRTYRLPDPEPAWMATGAERFWPFWKLLQSLRCEEQGEIPRVVVLENVPGALTSHGGDDFAETFRALRPGRIPHRPDGNRCSSLFATISSEIICAGGRSGPRRFRHPFSTSSAIKPWHSRAIEDVYSAFSPYYRQKWIWWRLPPPPDCDVAIDDLIEDEPDGVEWHTRAETARLLSHMNPLNLSKVDQVRGSGKRKVGFVYKRTRPQADGQKRQRAEVRFDGISGCLRTPVGGSSRQTVLIVEGGQVRSRLLSPREAARLMGLPDSYRLPERYNEAYHVAGDGVAVPVVRHLAENLLHPILSPQNRLERAA